MLPILIGGLCVLSGCNKQEVSANHSQGSVVKKAEHEQGNLSFWPTLKSKVVKTPEIENTIAQYLKTMTLEQKVAQMIQPEIRDISVEDMRKYGFGSYLNGGGQSDKSPCSCSVFLVKFALYRAYIKFIVGSASIFNLINH